MMQLKLDSDQYQTMMDELITDGYDEHIELAEDEKIGAITLSPREKSKRIEEQQEVVFNAVREDQQLKQTAAELLKEIQNEKHIAANNYELKTLLGIKSEQTTIVPVKIDEPPIINTLEYGVEEMTLPSPYESLSFQTRVVRTSPKVIFDLEFYARIYFVPSFIEEYMPGIDQLVERLTQRNEIDFLPVKHDDRTLYFGLDKKEEAYLITKSDTALSLYAGSNGTQYLRAKTVDTYDLHFDNVMTILNHILNPNSKEMMDTETITLKLYNKNSMQ